MDFWHLLDLQVPPSATCALLSPLAKLDIMRVNATWKGNGAIKVQPKDSDTAHESDLHSFTICIYAMHFLHVYMHHPHHDICMIHI